MLPLHTVRVTRQSMGMATIALLTACTAEPRVPSRPLDSAAETDVVKQIPGPAATPARSPDAFRVAVETSKGTFTIAVQRALAPRGADRFFELVTAGYFTDVRFFRVVPGFVVQFGMHGDPAVNALWERATLLDEPRRMSNTRGKWPSPLLVPTPGPCSYSSTRPTTVANSMVSDCLRPLVQ